MDRPPCWPDRQPCPNPCAEAHYQRVVYGHQYLTAEWRGWRLVGRVLVSPDGDRITPERLRGLMFLESMRSARKAVRQEEGATVVRIRARDSLTEA